MRTDPKTKRRRVVSASKKQRRVRVRYSARTADRYELYQLAVQSPEDDLSLLRRMFRKYAGREPLHLREDFCGTALLSATWVAKRRECTAEGYDLDPVPLAWGQQHNLAPLGAASSRVVLHQADVREPGRRRVDIRLAQNFSWFVFKQRAELVDYFRRARRSLAPDGMLALDLYGGLEAGATLEEERVCEGGFKYVWDQARFLPGTADYTCHIHFEFRDGTKMKKAFSYEWRLWTLPEVREILHEAGFGQVDAWFEQSDEEDGDGNGIFRVDPQGKSAIDCDGWIAYVIARK